MSADEKLQSVIQLCDRVILHELERPSLYAGSPVSLVRQVDHLVAVLEMAAPERFSERRLWRNGGGANFQAWHQDLGWGVTELAWYGINIAEVLTGAGVILELPGPKKRLNKKVPAIEEFENNVLRILREDEIMFWSNSGVFKACAILYGETWLKCFFQALPDQDLPEMTLMEIAVGEEHKRLSVPKKLRIDRDEHAHQLRITEGLSS